jgi:hypothetical protein
MLVPATAESVGARFGDTPQTEGPASALAGPVLGEDDLRLFPPAFYQ